MRAVFGLVLVVGIALAGFAVYMAQGYFEEQQRALERTRAVAAQAVPTVDVVAVKRSIGYGETLAPDDVEIIKYAEPYLPEGVFRTMEELFPEGEDLLRVVTRPMEPKEVVMAIKVTEPGQDVGITSRLSPGMRAFTIKVDAISGVSGFLRPGDRVDVYWTGNAGIGGSAGVTKLILSGVEIIAVDQSADGARVEASVARTVTVEASPVQVAALAQAQSTGNLSLALVGADDSTMAEAVQIDQSTLLGIVEAAPTVQSPDEVCTIRARRGTQTVDIPIPCTD